MVHQPRRRTARRITALLGALAVVGLVIEVTWPSVGRGPRSATAAADVAPVVGVDLAAETLHIYQALRQLRAHANLPVVELDDGLVDSAERDACAIARGELHLTAVGADRENVGLVVDSDPLSAARAMHDWWTQTAEHRADRIDPDMRRYGIGACTDDDRTYFVERFAA
jgi:uncharacterized protein YkwD